MRYSFDIWHAAKNLGKRLNAYAVEAKYKKLRGWVSHVKKSISGGAQRHLVVTNQCLGYLFSLPACLPVPLCPVPLPCSQICKMYFLFITIVVILCFRNDG